MRRRAGAATMRSSGAPPLPLRSRMIATQASRTGRTAGPSARKSGAASMPTAPAPQPLRRHRRRLRLRLRRRRPSIATPACRLGCTPGPTRRSSGVARTSTLVATPRSLCPCQRPRRQRPRCRSTAWRVSRIGCMAGPGPKRPGVASTRARDARATGAWRGRPLPNTGGPALPAAPLPPPTMQGARRLCLVGARTDLGAPCPCRTPLCSGASLPCGQRSPRACAGTCLGQRSSRPGLRRL
mmetsp:Transcript_119262/g.362827  ORF Transcript_119262/g.362827 Transcript_119262/m.362827 type:complete len:240 (+) Transcript_119262:680-1399(+)